MGWASGSSVADSVWDAVSCWIPEENKIHVARELMDLFQDMDCDMARTKLWSIVMQKCPDIKELQDEDEREVFENHTYDTKCQTCHGNGWVRR